MTRFSPLILLVMLFACDARGGVMGTGDISGVFTDDVPTSSAPQIFNLVDPLPMVSQGSGTSSYNWGYGSPLRWFLDGDEMPLAVIDALPFDQKIARATFELGISDNLLSFASDGFMDQPKGETFVAGLLTYFNGGSSTGSDVPSVTLTLDSDSLDPDFTQTLDLPISIVSTFNVNDPFLSADFIYFTDRPDLGSFRVFENASTSVQVLAEFNSLDLIGFGAVTDPNVGFVTSSVGAIPEPTSLAIFSIGALGLVAGGIRRRKQKQSA